MQTQDDAGYAQQVAASVALIAAVALLGSSTSGCGGPMGPFAGGRLTGEVVNDPVDDWSFAKQYELVQIETRPDDPYSVNINFYVVGGRLYIEASPDRTFSRWRNHLWADPNVRVRFGERVYEVKAVEVTDPEEIVKILPVFYEKDSDAPPAACLSHRIDASCPSPGVFVRLDPR